MKKQLTTIRKTQLLIGLSMFLLAPICAQEGEWEPQTHVTGYASTEIDYFKNIKIFRRDHDVSLAEGGVLCSYQPLQKLTIKGVFVYRPSFAFNDMLNELNGEYRVNDLLQIQGGRFLTPLSPVNTNYYAVANTAITLPFLVSFHENYPVSMNGLAFKGSVGDNIKLNYNVFGGGYFYSIYLPTGALGLFGKEALYFRYTGMGATSFPDLTAYNNTMQTGEGAHVDVLLFNMLTLGIGGFKTKTYEQAPAGPGGTWINTKSDRKVLGLNMQFKYNTLKLSAEYWNANSKSSLGNVTYKIKSSYVELSNSFGKFTPYLRYEDHKITDKLSRYTAGLNYRPMFEITLKAEYLHYNNTGDKNLDGFSGALIYSF